MGMKNKTLNETLQNIILLANQTVANHFEHFNLSIEQIKNIIENKTDGVDEHEYRTINQFNDAFMWVLVSDEKLAFDKIKDIHQKVAHKIALNAGEFALFDRKVSSNELDTICIPPKNEDLAKREFDTLINLLSKENNVQIKKEKIMSYFIEEITEQWFHDANKRTSLLVANKLLLDYVKGERISLIIDFDNKQFDDLLAKVYINKFVYANKYTSAINELNKFLVNSITEYDSKELNDQINLFKTELNSLSDIFLTTNDN